MPVPYILNIVISAREGGATSFDQLRPQLSVHVAIIKSNGSRTQLDLASISISHPARSRIQLDLALILAS